MNRRLLVIQYAIIVLALIAIIFTTISTTVDAANIEVSGAVNYTENVDRDEDGFLRKRVRVAHLIELGEKSKCDILYGVEYQVKEKDRDHNIVPQVGFRYYPVDFMTLHTGATLGGNIETEQGFSMSPTIEATLGIGRREVLLESFIGIDDRKDFNAGVRAGYIFDF